MLWVGWTALHSAERGRIWSNNSLRREAKGVKSAEHINITEDGNGSFDSRSEYGYAASDYERKQEVYENVSVESWHVVLHVGEDASVDEIKISYKKLISQYHPDKVAALGYELRALAESKSKQINLAYEAALRIKGGCDPL
jgi:DnaJ-domain-containing protein 1